MKQNRTLFNYPHLIPIKRDTILDDQEFLELLEEQKRRNSQRFIQTLYPESGPLRRELYFKHMEFFEAGKTHRERCAICANRVGKTLGMGGFETTLHLTGLYEEIAPWWPGQRFPYPIRAWASNKTAILTRDITQTKLLGTKEEPGTGLIPGELIGRRTSKHGVPDANDTVYIKHISGNWSMLQFKSYDSGRQAYEGTEQDVCWNDEECPLDIHNECVIRTAITVPGRLPGLVYNTFTPLQGLTDTVLYFLEDLAPQSEH